MMFLCKYGKMMDLPVELICGITDYVDGKEYRCLVDNFGYLFNMDTKRGYVTKYYRDYIRTANKSIFTEVIYEDKDIYYIVFHLKNKIHLTQLFTCKFKVFEAMKKHCPFVIYKSDEIIVVKSDEVSMTYIDKLHLGINFGLEDCPIRHRQ